jgi:hypothetical protein
MKQLIKIYGNSENLLSVNLNDILECVENGEIYHWSILWLEAIGDLGSKSMLDFEEEVKKSENGLSIELRDLLSLSNRFKQIIEIVLIGDKLLSNVRKYSSDEEMISSLDFTIILENTPYWMVYTEDLKTINRIIKTLPGTILSE